ncbi:phage tail protein [Hufsiella ginkgonis]|uniref:Phage tail protein n=1 Tax=Hufsiella ginkgonis TaxID=2695274 RepID=A0A7K1Y201_9SPHI|nr:tail fiber protein [Hufsiella ginkgonis]MXV17049.1 phage tail protein [Hufsiella ginkgonis]
MDAYLGTILPWAPNYAPRGWSLCQGQILNISSNNALFAIIGAVYGGNGSSTFGLPNLQGRVPIGAGQSTGTSNYVLGTSQGAESVSLNLNNLPAHTHAATLTNAQVPPPVIMVSAADATDHLPTATVNTLAAPMDTANIAEIAGFNNLPPTQAINIGSTGTTISGPVVVSTNGASAPFSIIQPYQVVNFIICTVGIFPPRN